MSTNRKYHLGFLFANLLGPAARCRVLVGAAAALALLLAVGTTAAQDTLPTVSVSDAQVSEGGTWMTFVVLLSQPSSERVTVAVRTSGGTATSGTDFRGVSRTLTFPPNSRGQPVPVLVYDDQAPEPDETFTVTLTNPVGATLGDATATGTILDDGDTAARLAASDIEDTTATLTISGHTDGWWYRDRDTGTSQWGTCTAVAAGTTAVSISGLTAVTTYDYTAYSDNTCQTKLAKVEFRTIAPEGTPTVSVSDAQVSEDGTWMTFEVSLSHPSRERVTVDFQTSDGTATSGTDFRGVSRTLTISANSREPGRVPVLVYDDQAPEPDETFTVTLTNPVGATLGDATATGTIVDDGDTAARLAASDIEDTTATLTISGHTDGWWYRDRDTGTSRWGACTAVTAGTAAVSISGLTAAKDYEYTAYSDSGCSTKLAKVEFRTIAPEGTPTVSVSDAQVSEDGTWMTFVVLLSQPSRERVTVDFATSSGTATSGTDFRAVSRTLTFSANSRSPQRAPVLVYDDQAPEQDETFTVTLTNPVGATLGDATATGTILDDGDTAARLAASDIEDTTATLTISGHTDGWWYRDRDTGTSRWGTCTAVAAGTTAVSISGLTAVRTYDYTAYSDSACQTKLAKVEFRTIAPEGTPTVSVSDAQVSEDGTWMSFEVSLSHPSRERVTVDFQTSDGTATSGIDFRSVSRTLTFSANSRAPQQVPVLVYDDQAPEPDETFTLTLTNPVGATLGDATATGTIVDDGDTAATGDVGQAPDPVRARVRRVLRRTMTAVGTRTLTGALANVNARFADPVPETGVRLAGREVLTGGAVPAVWEHACPAVRYERSVYERALLGSAACGTVDLTRDDFMRVSAFTWTPVSAEGGETPDRPLWAVWGRGDFGSFEGRPEEGSRYEGETRTGWLGFDMRRGPWVAGVALSHGTGEADYGVDLGPGVSGSGRLETTLTALYPYGRWRFANGLELRLVVGAGQGEARHAPEEGDPETGDLDMRMASVGLRQELGAAWGFDLAVRADASFVRMEVEAGPATISGVSADTRRWRLGVEAARRVELGGGAALTPFIEVAARHDGGDGLTGSGVEIAGGARYTAPRFRIEARGRWLAAHAEEDARERGVSVTVRVGPGAEGRGLWFALSPRWGAPAEGAEALWRDEMPRLPVGAQEAALDARVGYGFAWDSQGLVTPFAETSAGGGSRRLRLGTRFEASRLDLGVELAGERTEREGEQKPVHGARLDVRLGF